MASPIRRRSVWLVGLLVGLIAATALVSVSVDEPARRDMEREINRRRAGYTVTVRALLVTPVTRWEVPQWR